MDRTQPIEINQKLLDEIPGDLTNDLETWLTSLTNQNLDDLRTYPDSGDDWFKIAAVGIELYCNEMEIETLPEENNGKIAKRLFMKVLVELDNEVLMRTDIVDRDPNTRRKIYKDTNIMLTIKGLDE